MKEKETFDALLSYYKLLPVSKKRMEIISKIENMISNYSKLCEIIGIIPNMNLNSDMLNIDENIDEEKFLHATFCYLNALEKINVEFINSINIILEKR